ncbi:BEST4 protein, partial [Fregetta grallaria]|nr:BEST4 protein [Fregetta grallaria]
MGGSGGGKVANSRFGGFSKLRGGWGGGIYKLLYKEFIVFVGGDGGGSLVYRRLLTEEQKRLGGKGGGYCNRSTDLIPMSFGGGFWGGLGGDRWWAQYTSIPLPDGGVWGGSSNVHGKDERGRILGGTGGGYANLSAVLILRSVRGGVGGGFPTMDHVVEAGFMTQDERKKFERGGSGGGKYWIPCVWFTNLAGGGRGGGRIRDDVALRLLMDGGGWGGRGGDQAPWRELLNLYRAKWGGLGGGDWISIPLVYTQVGGIGGGSFFAFCLIGRQFLGGGEGGEEGDLDMYVPLSTLGGVWGGAGWLKVAEQIINPGGEGGGDFETNKLIDRNLQGGGAGGGRCVSLLSVGGMGGGLPPAVKDKYWNESGGGPGGAMATAAETLKPSFLGGAWGGRMCEDVEGGERGGASPSMPRIQTPLLRGGFGGGSPAISIKNFSRGSRGGPGGGRPRTDGGFPSPYSGGAGGGESVARIEEEETEDEGGRGGGSTTPGSHPGGTRLRGGSGGARKELPLIRVKAPSGGGRGGDKLEAWEP